MNTEMKQLELELKKRLLIVEVPEEKLFSEEKQIKAVINSQKYVNELLGEVIDLTFICKGSDLTEEIATELVQEMYSSSEERIMYRDYKAKYDDEVVYTALESFISAIVAQGYYWGENPLGDEPEDISDLGNFTLMMRKKHQVWQEAESKNFNPEKSLIFEIL